MAIIRFFAPDTDAYVESVERHIDEFEELTGHTAHLNIIPNDQYFSNKIHSFLTGEDAAFFSELGTALATWISSGADVFEAVETGSVISEAVLSGSSTEMPAPTGGAVGGRAPKGRRRREDEDEDEVAIATVISLLSGS